MEINRIKLGISKIPKKYVWISVMILSLSLLSLLATGMLFKFRDEYTLTTILDKTKIRNGYLRLDKNSLFFLDNNPQDAKVKIYLESDTTSFIGEGILKVSNKSDSSYLVLTPFQVERFEIKFSKDTSCKVRFVFNGTNQNIFTRILKDHKN
jgi:hypothetical protein